MSRMRFRSTMTLWIAAFISVCALSISAQETQFATRFTRATSLTAISSITTLYAQDPIAHSLCLSDGREGGAFQNGGVFNRCSHIEFDKYKAGSLTVGIQGGELGRIIDLGTSDDLRKAYGYPNQWGLGFSSIVFSEGKLMIVKDQKKVTRVELVEAAQLFEGSGGQSAEAKPGHIYLARITNRAYKDFQILVKLVVLASTPGESVTFRWELL